jgi:PKD repeat protein
MRFNGTTASKIKLPSNSLIKPANDLSFSAWIKPESLTSMEIVFTKNIYSMYYSAYALTFQNNGQGYKFRGYRQNGSTSNFIDGTTVVTNPNNWYHVVLTIDNNNMRIYVNGVLENIVTCFITSYNYQAGKEVILGGTNETVLDFPFLGSMDNVRFYNRVINASEVAALYNQDPACTSGTAPVTSFTSSAQQICPGASVFFNNTSLNSPTGYTWTINGGNPSSSSNSSVSSVFNSPGVYSVSLITSNAFGIGNTAVQTVTVVSNPVVSVVGPTASCLGQSVTLTGNGAATYTWNNSIASPTIVVSPTVITSYTLNAQSSLGCFGNTVYSLAVNPLPDVGVGSGVNGDTLCLGMVTNVFATGANSYAWSTNQTGPIITVSPSVTTVYTVTGTNASGCSKTVTIQLIVRVCDELTGLYKNIAQNQWRIFPNPVSEKLTISTEGLTEITWSISDVAGKMVISGELTNQNQTDINTEQLKAGLYFLSIQSAKEKVVFKVIKE